MPVIKGKDKNGSYFSWGKSGHRYHFKARSKQSESIARTKAARQGRAIKRSQSMR
jgi:hypothetical protein